MRNGTGDLEMMRLMSYKAACASRIYGPEFGYVTKVYGLLENNKNNICMLVENDCSNNSTSSGITILSRPWFIHAETILVNRSQEPSISHSFGKSQIRHCSGSDLSPQGVVGLIHGAYKKTKKSLAKPIPKPSTGRQGERVCCF
ncbi:hypothetical protein F2Q68_00043690 [Brassica cretica]|uniref:Uncharacterized protein n=1 Tax=Brassica cretica TaxID=69181 RepID=A0A8S9LM21_BRACR|nr:hypothetical protein F2Q68_00043690 [Brassica cretica]